jgi:hypothetical protein
MKKKTKKPRSRTVKKIVSKPLEIKIAANKPIQVSLPEKKSAESFGEVNSFVKASGQVFDEAKYQQFMTERSGKSKEERQQEFDEMFKKHSVN